MKKLHHQLPKVKYTSHFINPGKEKKEGVGPDNAHSFKCYLSPSKTNNSGRKIKNYVHPLNQTETVLRASACCVLPLAWIIGN